MEKLTTKDIKEIINLKLGTYLTGIGFVKKSQPGQLNYFLFKGKEYNLTYNNHLNHYDVIKLMYSFGFGLTDVLRILKKINNLELKDKIFNKEIFTLTGVNPSNLRDSYQNSSHQPTFSNENELLLVLDGVIEFYEQTAMPLFNKLANIFYLDEMINSTNDRWN